MADKNEWGSNLSFILAMIGSAVGLGNIWRYPYVLYSNGGGAFYIPYIVAILLMGIRQSGRFTPIGNTWAGFCRLLFL